MIPLQSSVNDSEKYNRIIKLLFFIRHQPISVFKKMCVLNIVSLQNLHVTVADPGGATGAPPPLKFYRL